MIVSPNTLIQNRYLIVRLIAQGGIGAVYQATDQKTGGVVALKQLLATDAEFVKAFDREVLLLARLRHSALPAVSNHFSNESGKFLVMQYIPGDDLGTLLERDRKKFLAASALPWILRWADQLLDALEYLHNQDPPVIHRDIKPQNLKPTSRGEIMLLDFGMAKGSVGHTKFTTAHSVRGYTPQYAPLEQIQGTGTDMRSDIYSLGATLYHLMTGVAPPDALSRVAAKLSGKSDPLRSASELNPLVPPGVAVIIHQAMEQEMAHRFATASAMRTALRMTTQPKKPPVAQGKGDEGSSGIKTIVSSAGNRPPMPPPDSEPLVDTSADTGTGTGTGTGDKKPASEIKRISTSPLSQLYPTLVVDQQGKAHFKTIGEAIRKASAGTRIIVRPGTYQEGIMLDKPLDIVGEGSPEQIIVETRGYTGIQMHTDYARVRGITVRTLAGPAGAKDQTTFAVDVGQGRLVLDSCDIAAETFACIAIHTPAANPLIWRCKIHDGRGTGIFVYEKGRGCIEECELWGHGLAGIGIAQGSNPVVRHCKIHRMKQCGIYISEKGAGFIEGCDIFANERAGIEIKREGRPIVRGCQIHDQTKGYGVYVYEQGEGLLESCDIFGNAEAGVRVHNGGRPFLYRCTIHNEKQWGISFIENGYGVVDECDIHHNNESGISIAQDSKPIIRQSHIHESGQSGVLVWDGGAGVLEDCSIVGNARAGLEVNQQGNPTLRRCTISQNKMMAVQVYEDGGASVEECDLSGNKRGAWSVEDGCLVLGSGNRE